MIRTPQTLSKPFDVAIFVGAVADNPRRRITLSLSGLRDDDGSDVGVAAVVCAASQAGAAIDPCHDRQVGGQGHIVEFAVSFPDNSLTIGTYAASLTATRGDGSFETQALTVVVMQSLDARDEAAGLDPDALPSFSQTSYSWWPLALGGRSTTVTIPLASRWAGRTATQTVVGQVADPSGRLAEVIRSRQALNVQISHPGTFMGKIDLLPGADAGEVTLTIHAKDRWLFPLLVLIAALAISILLNWWAKKRRGASLLAAGLGELTNRALALQKAAHPPPSGYPLRLRGARASTKSTPRATSDPKRLRACWVAR